MHTVDLLDCAIATARDLGYQVRLEWLGGNGGGACEFGGRKWIFLDLALTTSEQLDLLVDALEADPRIRERQVASPLDRILRRRRRAA